jgi:hypothetical protein
MNVMHVTKNAQQKWIIEPCTAMEHQEMEKIILTLKTQFKVDIKKINESFAQENLNVYL